MVTTGSTLHPGSLELLLDTNLLKLVKPDLI